ncbi:sarcosine oxidase subunit gamma [Marinomonas fungiae]|uniref:Sarcosine oxidase gamma subunit n=1 Tax=Marinomonas fungiae TaxID=1137284 RepID=A0A0K6IPK7_9GAMM|nr:sarcosine oxidase subunit gamma family protein [Marinomonas fungiae]CUB05033.1 Sarcosine oxidase gamma subunit [Marinomonas fungiae]
MSDVKTEAVTVSVINQLPDASIQGQSPLFHADLATIAKSGPKTGGVTLKEEALLGHLTLRMNPENADQLKAAEKVLGVALPTQPLTSASKGDVVVRWISPDEWLITVPGLKAFEVETAFQKEMKGHFQVVNVSGGQTIVKLSGKYAQYVIKKSSPIDIHPSEFPVGKVVTSVFAKSSAIIRRSGENEFELVIRRSFSDYLWLWLQDASREYGLVIEA